MKLSCKLLYTALALPIVMLIATISSQIANIISLKNQIASIKTSFFKNENDLKIPTEKNKELKLELQNEAYALVSTKNSIYCYSKIPKIFKFPSDKEIDEAASLMKKLSRSVYQIPLQENRLPPDTPKPYEITKQNNETIEKIKILLKID